MSRKRKRRTVDTGASPGPSAEEGLLAPPPAEAVSEPSDRERRAIEEATRYGATSPELSGGDQDADWRRGDSSGEEAVGGSVATPDQDTIDQLGDALGVPRAPDEPVRTAQEILEARDARRAREPG
jgi:Family of unknown function (DUF6335)